MLTMERVIAAQRLLDVVMYMFENEVGANKIASFCTSLESMHGRYCIENEYTDAWYCILRAIDDDWFIVAIHPEAEAGYRRNWNAYANKTPLGQMTCTYCSNAPSAFNIPDRNLVLETLSGTEVTDGDLFQLQTLHDDRDVMALVLEAYLRHKIKDNYYVPVNIDKLLSMEVYNIENVTEFWQDYIDAYEELV